MQNFYYYNPVKIIFGKNTTQQISSLIPTHHKILLTYGGSSIKKNGLYEKIKSHLHKHSVIEFGGIEPNPQSHTLHKAIHLAQKEKIDFILAVGGGSVIDGSKYIAAGITSNHKNFWSQWQQGAPITKALPLGVILTLSATGSEMNSISVISDSETGLKYAFAAEPLFPQFSILDPTLTMSLSTQQIQNGIVDPFIHVTEQYLTYPSQSPLQDRQAEGILKTLIEEGPLALKDPQNYDARANLMWSATQALNGLIACGVPQDWATHRIGHDLTTYYGLDHAQTLAIILPALLRVQFEEKKEKLFQCGQRVFNLPLKSLSDAHLTIVAIENFFQSLGVHTHISQYGFKDKSCFQKIVDHVCPGDKKLGERRSLGREQVLQILEQAF